MLPKLASRGVQLSLEQRKKTQSRQMILQNCVLPNWNSLVSEVAEPSATFIEFSGSQHAHHFLKQCSWSQEPSHQTKLIV